MSAKSTGLVDAVITRLESISVANGFSTEAGQVVSRGRPEAMTIDRTELPMIAVSTEQSSNETVRPDVVQKIREITVDGLVAAVERDYEPALDDLDEDIARALAPLTRRNEVPGATRITITGGGYRHPDAGSNLAAVTYTVTISHTLTIST